MTKKNIIIVGYPKSGTTWLSRLVAELVSCPLMGDWGYEELNPPYKDGLDKVSEFQVFKSHHISQEISKASELEIYKIIYIIRDPRDVVISGIHFFSFLPKFLRKKERILNINQILRNTFNRIVSYKEKKRQMIQAVLNGNDKINPWLALSWKNHYSSYANNDVCIVKYENLLISPKEECKNILNFLEIEKDKEHIKTSINNQSFEKMKVLFKHSALNKNIRKGNQGYWKKEFVDKEVELFKIENPNIYYNF